MPSTRIPEIPNFDQQDTLRADSLGSTPAESLRTAARSDSLRRLHLGHQWIRAALPPDSLKPAPLAAPGLRRLRESPEGNLREILGWEAPLARMPGGSYQTPDPEDPGDLPGREPPSTLLEGFPRAPAGYPEMPPDDVGALWLSRLTLRPADPILLPANPTGGPVLEMDLARPDSGRATSAVRLTSGTSSTYTEEAYLAVPVRPGLARIFYQDHKTLGREAFGREFGQNLLIRFDRGESWGGWHAGWHRAKAFYDRPDFTRLVWDPTTWDAGLVWKRAGWSADLGLGWTSSELALQLLEYPIVRKEDQTRLLLRLRGPASGIRPLATIQFDRQRQRYDHPGVLHLDRRWNGLSFAGGGDVVSGNWRLSGSAGLATPAPGRSGWTAAIDLQRAGSGWMFRAHADRALREPLLPRLADEFSTLIGQGLTVPFVDTDRPLEEVRRAEAGISTGPEGSADQRLREEDGSEGGYPAAPAEEGHDAWANGRLGLLARVVEIRHTASAEGGLLRFFQPNAYRFLPVDALDRTVRVASLHANAELPIRYGFRIEAWAGARVAHPGWSEQLWMTPWDGRFRLSWRHRFFQGDLDFEGYLRTMVSGERATPYGILGSSARYDAGAIARIRTVSLFLLLQNLRDSFNEAAAYDGTWYYLPFRSYRLGLVWRFLD